MQDEQGRDAAPPPDSQRGYTGESTHHRPGVSILHSATRAVLEPLAGVTLPPALFSSSAYSRKQGYISTKCVSYPLSSTPVDAQKR